MFQVDPGGAGSEAVGAGPSRGRSWAARGRAPYSSVGSETRTLTVRLGIEFDGTGFHGWQIQPRDRTVQGEIEEALRRVTGAAVRIAGAGRTDSGCHAAGQVASATLSTRLTPERLKAALNAHF